MIRIADVEVFRAGLWETLVSAEVVSADRHRLLPVADENLM